MSVKDLIIQAPILCGAYNAEKHSKVNQIIFEHEIENNSFPKKDGEDAYDRIAFLFDWPCDEEYKRDYCIDLAAFTVMKHYQKNHKDIESVEESLILEESLVASEPEFPDVSAILSVESAARGNW